MSLTAQIPSPDPVQIKRCQARITAKFKFFESRDAELRRKQTQQIVDRMGKQSTPDARISAAKAQARSTYAKIDQINAQADLAETQSASSPDIHAIRMDDLEALYAARQHLPEPFRQRIEKIHAKMHWETKDGQKGHFNKALHENDIPVDKHLAILAHLKAEHWLDSVIECGLFPKVKKAIYKKGKKVGEEHQFHFTCRCQDGERCNLCNYINISDGLKMLLESYDESAFLKGGNWFAITLAPRTDPSKARAVGRNLKPEDWDNENPDSLVFRESHQGREFKYPDVFDTDKGGDLHLESSIRRFLGACRLTFGKLVKNGWLDGVRAKVENSIEFLPFASHQHWHGVGSSKAEHDPQKMADFIKNEIDDILRRTCRGLYVDVMVAAIPSAEDLSHWIRYMNKIVDLVGAIDSVYNRHPNLRRDNDLFAELCEELRLYPERADRVFGSIRLHNPYDERGVHTYKLNRRYATGNHKFGVGSILSESEEHLKYRKRHAKTEAENRKRSKARRLARRLGFGIEMCPERKPDAEDYGTYRVVSDESGEIVAAGPSGQYGLSLRQCQNFLSRLQSQPRSSLG